MATLKKRFALLAAVSLAVIPVLSACGTQATPTPAPQATNTTAPAGGTGGAASEGVAALQAEGITGDPNASGKLEFFSWWTAGGEAEGKNDILNLFKQLYPGVEIVDAAVAGGGGDQAKAVLKTRMQGNDPPDTFQVHGGPELLVGFVDADRMDTIQDVWDELKLGDALPKQLQDMVSKDGTPYAVPANVHRGNVLFYNKKVFTDNGLSAPTTWDEFMTAADTLKGKGITPLGVGGKDTWAVTMLFEDLLLANGGADTFNSLMAGDTEWTDPAVVESLTMLGEMVTKGYFGDNFSGLTWDAASGEVLNGRAAMTIMGDWAKGYFQANDPDWADNFGWAPSPGTTGIFKVITDAFGLPKGAKNPDNTKNFLRVLGSKTGQVTFNLRKGSIPARTDVDTSAFDVYMKDAARDFGAAEALVGSAPHGSGTVEAFASQLNTAINTFAASPADAAAAAADIQAQAADLLK
ncbi:MAG TPA: extracellular solute-binding protein [Chloroflexia bacterium]|nr:extracellular solute-binding protein [Chloroflexia bacterium]